MSVAGRSHSSGVRTIRVMARSYQNMANEMFLKASLYNMFMGMKV
ncbi:MAG TPA: hypothetical protein VNI77_03040 [Nitrososphaera sp.]|nr:hypothetical protein [Nitrososphaera sp.]